MRMGSFMKTVPSLSKTPFDYEDTTFSSRYGCCPDGLTRSKGLNFKGCDNATPCKDAKWGCCDDLMNPAHGPNKEGCCIETDFGKNRIFLKKKYFFL